MPFTAEGNWFEIRTEDSSPGRPALFLDRDGVLIEERHYVRDPDEVELVPGSPEVLRAAMRRGYRLVITSNQSGIGRGLLDWPDLFAVQERLRTLWAVHGLRWDMALFCPYHPSEGRGPHRRDDPWRKPRDGMIRFAAERLGIDIARSVSVGDRLRDIEAAATAGVGRLVHVATGHGASERARVASRFPEAEFLPSIAALDPAAAAPAVAEAARAG
jgi:D-glycero-D-manno-heptose 1,7-bisphosphate phosphatase